MTLLQENFNRGVATFSDHDCWRLFRFRRLDLERLMHLLALPINFEVKGGRNGSVLGEYAFLITLHRLSYPSTLENMEIIWGKDYTFLSKVFNTALDWLYDNHRHRIIGNIQWYSDRFDYYNQVLNLFINLKLLFLLYYLFSYSKFVGPYFSRHTFLFLVRFLRILIEFLLSWTDPPRKCADRVDFPLYRMLCGMDTITAITLSGKA